MVKRIEDMSSATLAKIAGVGYLVIFFSGFFANFFVLEGLIIPGDAVGTAGNIVADSGLFRWGFVSFVVMVTVDIVLAWVLYLLFLPVNRNLSLFAAWLRLVNGAVFAVALYHLFSVLRLSGGAASLGVFGAGEIPAHIMLSLTAFSDTWLIGLIFFALHLFMLGLMVVMSGLIPRALGVLLMIAAAGYLTDSFANILIQDYDAHKALFLMIVAVPGVIGELSFSLWLLIKGVRTPV